VWVKIASDSVIGDENCAGIGYNTSITLSSCESACLAMASCTAIDFNPATGQCTYRQCTPYPPNYRSQSGWEVWAIPTSLVWVKIASDSVIGNANCVEVAYSPSTTMNFCESSCLFLTHCTAIDFNPATEQCKYRYCTTYPPKYQSQRGWEVWAIERAISTITNSSSSSCQLTFEKVYVYNNVYHIDDTLNGAIAVSDLNNDGLWDILIPLFHANSPRIAILFGNGNGSFIRSTMTDTGCGYPAAYVVVADINKDVQMDIVTACIRYEGRLGILLGDGDETFRETTSYSTGRASSPIWLDTGDFNGDGNLDIVASLSGILGDRSVGVLLGDGNGFFEGCKQYSAGQNSPPMSLVVGDFDNDRLLDIAIGKLNEPRIIVLRGYGNGSFGPPIANEQESIIFSSWIGAADINNDGYLDIIVTNIGLSNVAVLLGKGDGTFRPTMTFSTGYFSAPRSAAIEDFNGDGMLDIAVLNGAVWNVGVLLGYGNGTFGLPMTFSFPFGMSLLTMAAADFNRDGRMDIAVAIQSSTISLCILINTCECCEREFFNMSRITHQ
ncbi:unnamed protein product, partial [Adineta steineri]